MGGIARPGEFRFLDPAVLARLGTLELRARTVVEGFLSGLHRSPLKGFSVEFAEYRQYFPGDDLASIDWKVYARSDRYCVKKFDEETNLDCHLLLDVSGSMGYAGSAFATRSATPGAGGGEASVHAAESSGLAISKLEYASMLAASLAYLMNRQRDAVGLTTFDEAIVEMLPPGSRPGHLRSILLTLDRSTAAGARTDVSKPLHLLADAIGKRGMVVVLSDLIDDPQRVVEGLRHFRFRGTDVIVLHVLHPDELTFPFERPARFRDMEGDAELMAVPGAVRREYLDELHRTFDFYARELTSAGIDYQRIETSQPIDFALAAYLSRRGRRR
jgi:uncharacterized protein (DUF58 family)